MPMFKHTLYVTVMQTQINEVRDSDKLSSVFHTCFQPFVINAEHSNNWQDAVQMQRDHMTPFASPNNKNDLKVHSVSLVICAIQ